MQCLGWSVLCLAFVAYLASVSASTSGLYVDNGWDQTVLQQSLSRQEKRAVQHEILGLLGLPERPRRTAATSSSAPLRRRSAPKFLLDVYKSLLEEQEEGESGEKRTKRDLDGLMLTGEEQQAIDQSDIIMTFESDSKHVSSVRHERGKRLWFNVSEVPSLGENIVGAELRLYQTGNYSANLTKPEAVFTVSAYQVVVNAEDGLELSGAANTTVGRSGWLEVNLTRALAAWVALPASNRGLYLSVHPVDRPAHEVRPEDIGLVTTTRGDDDQQPFLVAFFKAANNANNNNANKGKIRTTRQANTPSRPKKSEYNPATSLRHTYTEAAYGSSRSCKIQNLYISFKDLQWQDWIIAPDGYAAYYCAGECKFPLNAHMNATNHAIVQNLVHFIAPSSAPKPCCAPTKLTPISVLYFLDDTNVILKKYKKMVVKSCGCH